MNPEGMEQMISLSPGCILISRLIPCPKFTTYWRQTSTWAHSFFSFQVPRLVVSVTKIVSYSTTQRQQNHNYCKRDNAITEYLCRLAINTKWHTRLVNPRFLFFWISSQVLEFAFLFPSGVKFDFAWWKKKDFSIACSVSLCWSQMGPFASIASGYHMSV